MDHSLFYELTAVLLAAGLIALLISLLKQPSVLAFIITGILVGSVGYSQLHATTVFTDLGEIGITLLLFMVGLELDIRRLKELGKIVVITSVGQIICTSTLAFLLARLLGFTPISAMYIAIALTFSSTIIVVKLLGEKQQLQSLHGRIIVGCSIVQDFAALIVLLFLGSSSGDWASIFSSLPAWQLILITLVRALIFFLLLALVSKKVLPWLLKYLSRSDELLLSFSLGWALGLAAFAALPWVGFNFEIGGFLAGLALANSEVHWEIAARVKSIRDFFIIIFFIVFGSQLVFGNLATQLPIAIILAAFMLIGTPLIVMALLGSQGFKPKTAFQVGAAVVPMSEFSFILVALGFKVGQVSQSVVSVVTMAGLISIACSSYYILYSEKLYEWCKPMLAVFDWKLGADQKTSDTILKRHVVLIGAHRVGHHVVDSLQKLNGPLVIVDINPEVTAEFEALGLTAVCGDITESYIQEQVNLAEAKIIISTIPSFDDNLALLEAIKRKTEHKRIKPKLIFAAQTENEARKLYEQEIDYALSPHYIGGQHLARILEGKDSGFGLKKLRESHLKILSK